MRNSCCHFLAVFSVITSSYIISIISIEFIYLLVVVGVLFSLAGICLLSIDLYICCHFLVVFSEHPRTLFQSFGLSLFIYLFIGCRWCPVSLAGICPWSIDLHLAIIGSFSHLIYDNCDVTRIYLIWILFSLVIHRPYHQDLVIKKTSLW